MNVSLGLYAPIIPPWAEETDDYDDDETYGKGGKWTKEEVSTFLQQAIVILFINFSRTKSFAVQLTCTE